MPHGMAPQASLSRVPRVWVLMGQKAGDNSQVLAMAEALGWPFEIKRFVYRRYELATNLLLGPTLVGVVAEKSTHLTGPWPDLIISAGRRNEPIARWIQKEAQEEGKRVRLVHIGRPWAKLERFDLVVTTPQYRLPIRPNVLHNKTPLHRVTKERLANEATEWRRRLAHLPRPFVSVIIGGSSGPYHFDHAAAARLAAQASALAAKMGGSLLVTTSARTPVATMETFRANLTVPAYVFLWSKEATENPYFAFLGLADAHIVTGDSMSMLTEACATRKPVHIFDLGEGSNAMRPAERVETGDRSRLAVGLGHLRAALYRVMMRIGPQRLSRDIRIIHRYLTDTGRAVWLGDDFPAGLPLPSLDCLSRSVARVRSLFESPLPIEAPAYETLTPFEPLRRSA